MIRVSFIINSTRKRSAVAQKTISLAKKSSELEIIEIVTEYEKHAIEIAKFEASKSTIIVAVGGDGTFNEVIQGLIESENETIKLGLIPNGTGNDFIRMLPEFNPEKFVQALELNKGKFIDLGKSEFENQSRYFINISDLGFGANVVQIMTKQRKKNFGGKMSYSLAIIRAFFTYKKKEVKIVGDDFEFEGKVLMVAFCNGRVFGHGLTINPDAALDNGHLNITIIANVSLLTYIRKLGDLKRGKKIVHPEAYYYKSKSLRVSGVDSSTMWMEGDGELFDLDVQKVSVVENGICIINPQG